MQPPQESLSGEQGESVGVQGLSWPLSPEEMLARISPSEMLRLKIFFAWWREREAVKAKEEPVVSPAGITYGKR